MTWHYKGAELTLPPEGAVGFVYKIHDLMNDQYYIGKKQFYNKVTKPPLKGTKRKRHSTRESDWQDYYGSNTKLNLMVGALGPDHFLREILYICNSLRDMSYLEAKTQFELDVLHDPRAYNEIINCRINSRGWK